MTYIEICGGQKLSGEIAVQGSKNAALPMIAAAVLHKGEIRIKHCPNIADVKSMMEIITVAGGKAFFEQDTLVLNTTNMQPFAELCHPPPSQKGADIFAGLPQPSCLVSDCGTWSGRGMFLP